jgi:hypothetical protein
MAANRPAGKTYRAGPGSWPRVRAISFELRGYNRYPDSGPADPRAYGQLLANQDENDTALRRAAHRELDRMLDGMLPAMPLRPASRWISWVVPGLPRLSRYPNRQAHLIVSRAGTRVVKTACGLVRRPSLAGQESSYPVEPFNDDIKCPTCVTLARAQG